MYNPTSVLENETHELLWDFAIQIDLLTSPKRTELIIINKNKTCKDVDIVVLADHRVKLKESEKQNT